MLTGKAIVIIGGTSGIGLSAGLAVVRAGAKVVVVGLDAASCDAARGALGDAARVVTADARTPGAAEGAIALAVETWGRLDGLYHVAGGSGRRMGDGPLHEATDEGWEETLRLNVTSVFLSNRAAVRQFLKQDEKAGARPPTGGVVLNVGSALAGSPSPRHFATFAYAAAKSAIVGMTRSAAAYYAAQNVRFNVLAPGLVDTPMARRAAGDEAILSFVRTKQPLDGGRIGRPEDLDAAAVYLLSDQSRFVTGQVLCVDGGWGVSEGQYST
jgi:NAD(P)-dependent dehydrogenase (short-subunit alcohol dehydrogenase family)